jgi:hypothetical protein
MAETRRVRKAMKHRSIPGLLLAATLVLVACAPPDTGGGSSAAEPSAADSSAHEGGSHAPMDSEAPRETDAGGQYDY